MINIQIRQDLRWSWQEYDIKETKTGCYQMVITQCYKSDCVIVDSWELNNLSLQDLEMSLNGHGVNSDVLKEAVAQ